mmetsp:Transcript_44335/g.117595  ORF Transcript_44335/g.117595 Transcript_44335/m.117595 type:complete len:233 (-) Transcript_44335:1016-1714(-)
MVFFWTVASRSCCAATLKSSANSTLGSSTCVPSARGRYCVSTTKLHHPPVGGPSAESLRIHSLAARDCCLRPSGLCVAGDFLPRCSTWCGSSLCAWCQAGFRTRGGKAAATRLSVNGGGYVTRAAETRRLEAPVVPCVGRLWRRRRASSRTAWDCGQVFSESFSVLFSKPSTSHHWSTNTRVCSSSCSACSLCQGVLRFQRGACAQFQNNCWSRLVPPQLRPIGTSSCALGP